MYCFSQSFQNHRSDELFACICLFGFLMICSNVFRRYVKNATLFSSMTRIAANTPGARRALGGNAPVMAQRLAMEGANILLAARFTEETMKTLPNSIKGMYHKTPKNLDTEEK